MDTSKDIKEKISGEGFAVIENVFTDEEVENLLSCISRVDSSKPALRKTNGLFAIRQLFKEVPEAVEIIFNGNFNLIFKNIWKRLFLLLSLFTLINPKNQSGL